MRYLSYSTCVCETLQQSQDKSVCSKKKALIDLVNRTVHKINLFTRQLITHMSPSLFFLNKIVIKAALKTQFAGKANMKKER
jgi:hypothetical protein